MTTTSRLDRIKQAYKQANERPARNDGASNTQYFKFWNMKPGQRAVVRFIADKNEDNIFGFTIEKKTHQLTINGEQKTVPCMEMYGEPCPICSLAQQFYKADDKVNGKRYYKKRQYLAQVLVVEDPLPADEATGTNSVGQVRTLAINYQIHNLIKDAIGSEDDPLEHDPDDVENGYDFVIKKTEAGGYATYVVGTKFMSKPRALTPTEIVAASEGAIDLTSLLPKNPGLEKIQAMLDADVAGGDFDDSPAPAAAPAPQPARRPAPAAPATPAPAPLAPAQSGDDADDLDDIIAAIQERRRGM